MAYATVAELLRKLGKENPTPAELDAANRALDAAAYEIDSYLGWLTAPPTLSPGQAALVGTVNLDRAGEHWRFQPYGALNSGPDLPPVLTARVSWYRHARKLDRLKTSWGFA